MQLSHIPKHIKIYGNTKFRGQDHGEIIEQMTFVSEIRKTEWGALLIHVKNEGKRTAQQAKIDIANGLCAGSPDIIILGSPPFLCEIKRRHYTKGTTTHAQISFLSKAQDKGCFVCYALGYEAAIEAFNEWVRGV